MHPSIHIYILRIGLHDYKTILPVSYLTKLIRLSRIVNRHIVFLYPPPPPPPSELFSKQLIIYSGKMNSRIPFTRLRINTCKN